MATLTNIDPTTKKPFLLPTRPVGKDFWDTTVDLTKEEIPTLFKTINQTTKWLDQVGVGNSTTQSIGTDAEFCKLATAPFAMTRELIKSGKEVVHFFKEPSFGSATKTIRAFNNLIAPAWDMADFARKFCGVSSESVAPLEAANGISMVFGQTWNGAESIGGIANSGLSEAKTDEEISIAKSKITQSLIDLVKAVSLIALGVFIILSVFFGIVLSPLAFLAVSTTATVFTILGYYHKKMFPT